MSEFVVNEENFAAAVNNAGPYARARLFRKMEKTRLRIGGFDRILPDNKDAREKRMGRVFITAGRNTERVPLPPSDIEEYVSRFVQYFSSKERK